MAHSQQAPSPAPILERFKYAVYVLGAVAIGVGVAVLLWRRPAPATITVIPPEPTAVPSVTPTPGPIEVYVTGAVANPESPVQVPYGSRVRDAIAQAGGETADADLSGVNLSQILDDGDMVHVPSRSGGGAAGTPTPNRADLVHVNYATVEELDMLPGIGPALAQRIVDYREQYGRFYSVEELLNVSGIGPKTLEDMRDQIVID